MKIASTSALFLASTTAAAHPGHGAQDWFHTHQDALIDAAMIAFACLVAVLVVRAMWKVVAK